MIKVHQQHMKVKYFNVNIDTKKKKYESCVTWMIKFQNNNSDAQASHE